jgi:hypothetical protein
MPKFSAFTPFGMLAFSSRPSRAESIHKSIKASHGTDNVTEDSEGALPARWYAWAMAIARAQYTLERAGNQADPLLVTELLPVLEHMYGVTPSYTDSLETRRAVLDVRYKLALGNIGLSVENALREALGADFVEWRPTPQPSAASYPDPASGYGNFKRSTRFKTITLMGPTTIIGSPMWISYEPRTGDTNPIQQGETVLLDPGRVGQQDRVTVLAALPNAFQATLARAHEAGTIGTTLAHPFWMSTLLHFLVVVKNGRALNRDVRRKTHEVLDRMLQGAASWDIVEETSSPGTSGPFRVGQSGIGIVPIGTITL